MNPSIRRLIEAAKAGEKPGKQKQVKPDPTSVKLVLDAPDDNEHATDQKPIPKSVAEAKAEVAVVAFGRLNPPTIGHEKMIQKMAAIAKQHGTKAKLYLSQTQDAKSNPLNYATKVKLASKAFGKHVDVVNDPSVKTFFDLPRTLNGSAQHLIVVAGSDRLPEYKKKLEAYNGKEYTFDKIEVASAGERDPDADGAEGMSASKARALARAGDVEAFKEALPTSVRGDAKSIMDAIRKGMNVNEETVSETYNGKGNARPGWMLRADPKLGQRVKKAIDIAKKRNASHGNDDLVKKEDIQEAATDYKSARQAASVASTQVRAAIQRRDFGSTIIDLMKKAEQAHVLAGQAAKAEGNAEAAKEHAAASKKHLEDRVAWEQKDKKLGSGKLAAGLSKSGHMPGPRKKLNESYSETDQRRLAKGIPLRGRHAPGGDDYDYDHPNSPYQRRPEKKAGDKFTGKDGRKWVRYKKADGTLGVKPLKEDEQLDEVLTLQARMKRRMAMNRLKTVMKAARKRALRKRADTPTLERRARKRARDLIRQRILKTVNYQDLPMSARARVDAQVAKRKKAISRIAMKMLPKLKRAEMSRQLGSPARLPAAGGPKPATEGVIAQALHNFLSEGASAPQPARLISLAAVPAYEAWCMSRGARISKQQREAIREGLTGTVVAPGKRTGEWIVESAAGQFIIPEYLADESALIAATSHLRIND